MTVKQNYKLREKLIWIGDTVLALIILVFSIFKLAIKGDKWYIAVIVIIAIILVLAIATLMGLINWLRVVGEVVKICRALGLKV